MDHYKTRRKGLDAFKEKSLKRDHKCKYCKKSTSWPYQIKGNTCIVKCRHCRKAQYHFTFDIA